ncbi:diadenylate cyclase CdaA [Spirochaeta cellobiosiphila]|uniref:diadenylate cyclase CdaA n=1 Tax=Spirochaeta cellobiosiphila TaxID=504483 RepID=UPI00056B1020|nr:diadenylate cyclase CdaA [Spirochaeta cellobiosiphila]
MDLLNTFLFREIIRPILDIALLSFLLYRGYRLLVQTRAIQLIKGLVLVLLLYGFANVFKLETVSWLLEIIAPGVVIAAAIVFQPELRKIFTQLGQGDWFKFQNRPKQSQLESILTAAEMLSGVRRGALITFVRKVGLKNIIDRGTPLNADITSSLLMTIFQFDTALHDGAVIIQGKKILSGGCFFPLSEQSDVRKSFGTRHRAALGLAEESDAVILVVSEESGAISLAYDSNLYYDLSIDEIRTRLKELLNFRLTAEEADVE